MLHLLDDWQEWNASDSRPQPQQIETLPGGLTNQSFILHLERGDYVLRVEAGNSDELDINRNSEYLVHQQAALIGLVPRIIYRSCKDDKYWIREYLPGSVLTSEDLTDETLLTMVDMLKKLHQLDADERIPSISVKAKAERYILPIRQLANGMLPESLETLLAELQQCLAKAPDNKRCICHMDPTLGNWIKTGRGLQLVDWEYAGVGHPLWDLAAIYQDARLNDHQQKLMLNHYFSGEGWSRDDWNYAKAQMNYLAALWYAAQGIWNLRELETYLLSLKAVNL